MLALAWLALAVDGRAADAAPDRDFALRAAAVIEVDPNGRVVWRLDEMAHPASVDVDMDDRRLVADRGRDSVTVFSARGDVLRRLDVPAPFDADFLPGDHLLITSERGGTVREYDAGGSVVWEYAGLQSPREADRLPSGNTLICEGGAHRVIEVNRQGAVVWSFADGLKLPADADVLGDEVIVADYNLHKILCRRRDGTACWRFDHIGHPSELEIMSDGTIVAAPHQAGMMLRFARDGRVLGVWRLGARVEDFTTTPTGNLLLALTPLKEGNAGPFSPAVAAQVLLRRPDERPTETERWPLPSPGMLALIGLVVASLLAVTLGYAKRGRVRPHLWWTCATLLVAIGAVGYSRGWAGGHADPTGKNLVVILFDSLRKDHVPWHGYWRNTAPNLMELSRRALVFDQYVVQAPWTKPSVASLFTSTYPSSHGAVEQTVDSQLPLSLATLAEVLGAAGYHTAAVMENPHMGDKNSTKGFDQGFRDYHYLAVSKFKDQLPALVTDRAIELLDKRPQDRPLFLFVFFLNPHYPYEPKAPHFGAKDAGPSNPGPINDYDGEILDADEQVGRLMAGLAERGLMDRTVVVFSTDHGEEFGEHGQTYHGKTLYDPVLNVPLVIAGLGRAGRFPGLVREIDLMPTLLDYLGAEVSGEVRRQMAGISVRELIDVGAPRTGLVAHSETKFVAHVDLISRRTEDVKVIADLKRPGAERYDLRQDPQELNDLLPASEAAGEIAALQQWTATLWRADRPAPAPAVVSDAELEQLRALGYFEAGGR